MTLQKKIISIEGRPIRRMDFRRVFLETVSYHAIRLQDSRSVPETGLLRDLHKWPLIRMDTYVPRMSS
jgi:hypothetical protein